MVMEAPSSSLSSLSVVLRNRLRATTVCCFGVGGGSGGGLAERMRWRRRAGAGDFRYDPLSYALNFDEGDDEDRAGGSRVDAFLLSLSPAGHGELRPGAAVVEGA